MLKIAEITFIMCNNMKTLLSIFDHSGIWSKPYKEAGWNVIQHDIKLGVDIFEDTIPAAIQDAVDGNKVNGILSAGPCTDFAASGARWWADKEFQPADYNSKDVAFDSTVEMSVYFVLATLFIVELFDPEFWAFENPVGRVNSLIPDMAAYGPRYFQPYWYGNPYSKKTGLWGKFNFPEPNNVVEPVYYINESGKRGSYMWAKLGGKSEKTKALRSITPAGFAQAFYDANH